MHNVVWGCAEILPSISLFQDFSDLVDLEILIFLEQILTIGIILNETAKRKSVKIY